MELREAILGWRDFYAALANVGAALVGLVFVGVSIHLARRPLAPDTRVLGVEAVVNLLHPLLAALAMLVPARPAAQGAGLLLLALAGLYTTARLARAAARGPRREPRVVLAYRYLTPLLAEAILLAGAIGLVAGLGVAVYAPATFAFLMLIVGIQNAWDLLLGDRGPPWRL